MGAKKMQMEVWKAWECEEKETCLIACNEKLKGSALIKRFPYE